MDGGSLSGKGSRARARVHLHCMEFEFEKMFGCGASDATTELTNTLFAEGTHVQLTVVCDECEWRYTLAVKRSLLNDFAGRCINCASSALSTSILDPALILDMQA